MFCKNVFLEILQISRKTPLREYFFDNVAGLRPKPKPKACKSIKRETLAQLFSSEICEISKNTFSYKTLPLAASGQIDQDEKSDVKLINNTNT